VSSPTAPSATSARGTRLRITYAVALLAIAGAVGWLVVGPLRSNIQYFRTPSEALASKADDGDRRFRLAGQVVEGSIEKTADGMTFDVTDGGATVHVVHAGNQPALFKDGAPVVCEGSWKGDRFASDRLLIRHGNEYRPPDVTTTAPNSG